MAGSSLTIHPFWPGHAAGLLGAQRAAVEAALAPDDADLLFAAALDAVRAGRA